MNPQPARAIVTISLMAAFADGRKDSAEREHVRRVAESLGDAADIDFMKLYQDVLLGRASLDAAAAELDTLELRQLAFEMAVGVVEADGRHDEAETAFLQRLESTLKLDHDQAETTVHRAEEVADARVAGTLPVEVAPVAVTAAEAAGPVIGRGIPFQNQIAPSDRPPRWRGGGRSDKTSRHKVNPVLPFVGIRHDAWRPSDATTPRATASPPRPLSVGRSRHHARQRRCSPRQKIGQVVGHATSPFQGQSETDGVCYNTPAIPVSMGPCT